MPTDSVVATRTCRILYYGPAGAGKRANLARIQQSLPSEHRLAVATEDPARNIAFLLRNGDKGDWQVFVQAVDTGDESAIGPERWQRAPFDGVVFVCDSGSSSLDQSLSAMEAFKATLDAWNKDLMSVPMVLQYNGRHQGQVLPVDQLESLLNPWGLLSYPAHAEEGEGVRETLKAVLSLSIGHILQHGEAVAAPPPPEVSDGGFDLSPPVPGTEDTLASRPAPPSPPPPAPRASAAPRAPKPPSAPAGPPTLVVPVRVPRSALGTAGEARIVLEIHVEDR